MVAAEFESRRGLRIKWSWPNLNFKEGLGLNDHGNQNPGEINDCG